MVGVCAKQVKDQKDSFNNPLSLCLYLANGATYPGGIKACGYINLVVGESVL